MLNQHFNQNASQSADAPSQDLDEASVVGQSAELDELERLAPRPHSLAETGIPPRVLEMLLIKHLSHVTDLDKSALTERLALSGKLVDELLQKLKAEALVEIRSDGRFDRSLRYGLTHKGMALAQYEWQRDGYLGPAPVSLEQYRHLVLRQTSRLDYVSPDRFVKGMADVLLTESMINRLGPAINSGRAIFIYGHPGTGKTYVSRRLVRLFSTSVLIPHALCIGEQVLAIFDPLVHKPRGSKNRQSLRLDEGIDPRWILCERPEVVVGGELTTDMLDVGYDDSHHCNKAPLQLKANNGILIIDDLGRQKVPVDAILNRWIVPLEERIDYLSMSSGEHFEVPFEQVLVFSTNLPPQDLVDEAFLRRIGYKIEFCPISREGYLQLWQAQCAKQGVECSDEVFAYLIDELHVRDGVPLLPCHPRDLVSLCRDQINFMRLPSVLSKDLIASIWASYFVTSSEQGGFHG